MSFFGVCIEKIDDVWAHPNADKLELAKLVNIDYQFVIAKGSFKKDDLVLYFPEDAVLPDPLLAKLGLTGKLGGAKKNRVKAIRLRGQYSQGVVGSLSILHDLGYESPANGNLATGEKVNWADTLGVEKYDPEVHTPGIPNASRVIQNPLPRGVRVYDLENAERYAKIVGGLIEKRVPVIVTEKLEGSHAILHLNEFGELKFCSRRTTLIEAETFWHKGMTNSKIYESLKKLREITPVNFTKITIRGELIGPGVQGNIYGLPDLQVRVFDVELDDNPIHAHSLHNSLVESGVFTVDQLAPVLFRGTLDEYLGGKTLREVSDGKSVLGDTNREGIVIKPVSELFERGLGRVILKQRSPLYLSESNL